MSPSPRGWPQLVLAKQEELRSTLPASSLLVLPELSKRTLRLTANGLDRLFSLYEGKKIEGKVGNLSPGSPGLGIVMKDGNPSLTLNIEKKEQQKGFCLRMEEGVRCLRGEERLYLLVGESLCRCTRIIPRP